MVFNKLFSKHTVYWFLSFMLLSKTTMSMANDKNINELAVCLDEIQLQLFFTAVRAPHFANKSAYRLLAKKGLTSDCDLQDSFQKGVHLKDVHPNKLSDYFLVIQLAGELTTIDKVNFKECQYTEDKININLTITKVESQDGVPVPVNAFVLLPLNETITARRQIMISATGYIQSFTGEISPMKKEPIESVSVTFRDG